MRTPVVLEQLASEAARGDIYQEIQARAVQSLSRPGRKPWVGKEDLWRILYEHGIHYNRDALHGALDWPREVDYGGRPPHDPLYNVEAAWGWLIEHSTLKIRL